MSASHLPSLEAVAFQVLAALERYERDCALMIERWPQLDLYHLASEQVETLRMYTSSLSEVRVQWIELLIAHAELVHVLWRGAYGGGSTPVALERVCEHHAHCIAALRTRCLRLLRSPPQR